MLRRLISCSGLVLSCVAAAMPAGGIVLGQVDDFQGVDVQGWSGGAAPTNIPNGGPNGAGDRYLRISSSNSNLGTNNTAQWTGNYSGAGVVRLNFHLNNLGANPLALRISLFGPGGTFTTTDEVVLPTGLGWASVEFALDPSEFTQTSGFGTFAQTLANVSTLLIRHDPDPISQSGQSNPVTGVLGIDNVTALPEPGGLPALAAGIAALAWLAGRRRRRGGR
jgi:hypothetical protein